MNTLAALHSASDGNWDREAIVIRARGISKGGALYLEAAVGLLSAYRANNDVFIWFSRGRCTKTDEAMLARDGALHESGSFSETREPTGSLRRSSVIFSLHQFNLFQHFSTISTPLPNWNARSNKPCSFFLLW